MFCKGGRFDGDDIGNAATKTLSPPPHSETKKALKTHTHTRTAWKPPTWPSSRARHEPRSALSDCTRATSSVFCACSSCFLGGLFCVCVFVCRRAGGGTAAAAGGGGKLQQLRRPLELKPLLPACTRSRPLPRRSGPLPGAFVFFGGAMARMDQQSACVSREHAACTRSGSQVHREYVRSAWPHKHKSAYTHLQRHLRHLCRQTAPPSPSSGQAPLQGRSGQL